MVLYIQTRTVSKIVDNIIYISFIFCLYVMYPKILYEVSFEFTFDFLVFTSLSQNFNHPKFKHGITNLIVLLHIYHNSKSFLKYVKYGSFSGFGKRPVMSVHIEPFSFLKYNVLSGLSNLSSASN